MTRLEQENTHFSSPTLQQTSTSCTENGTNVIKTRATPKKTSGEPCLSLSLSFFHDLRCCGTAIHCGPKPGLLQRDSHTHFSDVFDVNSLTAAAALVSSWCAHREPKAVGARGSWVCCSAAVWTADPLAHPFFHLLERTHPLQPPNGVDRFLERTARNSHALLVETRHGLPRYHNVAIRFLYEPA